MCQAAATAKPPAGPQTNAAILAHTGQAPIRLTSKATLQQQQKNGGGGGSDTPANDPLTVPDIPGVTDGTNMPANAAEVLWNVPLMTPQGVPWQYKQTVLPAGQAAPTPNLVKLKGWKEFNGKVQGIPLFRGAVPDDTQLDPAVLDQRKGLPGGVGFSQLRNDLTFPIGGRKA